MGIMSDEPLIDDTELDGFWDRWSNGTKVFYIVTLSEDDERIVRANDGTHAVELFVKHTNNKPNIITRVVEIPSPEGIAGVFEWWDSDDKHALYIKDAPWTHPDKRGKR